MISLLKSKVIFGTHKVSQEAISFAIQNGLILDTATGYNNANLISKAMDESKNTPVIITKFNPNDFNDGIEKSIKKHLDDLSNSKPDIVLIHSPLETDDRNVQAFLELKKLFPSSIIGISNFSASQIQYLLNNGCIPQVVSIEFHPYYQPLNLVNYCKKNNIIITGYRTFAKGQALNDPIIKELSKKYHCSESDIILTWSLICGVIPIVSSSKFTNISNFIDFNKNKHDAINLDPDDLAKLKSLNKGFNGSTCMTRYCQHDG